MTGYLDDLAARLRDGGVPAGRVSALIGDLAAYLQESGGDPEAEFGPVEVFAAELTGDGGQAEPTPEDGAEIWRWAADVAVDEQLLNHFGDQGWEVQRVDTLRRFVCRRDPDHPQRWEYRRELVSPGDSRPLEARLAPDGWEPCGTWAVYQWFKRPMAASVGPAATLSAPPPPPTRHGFLSRRFALTLAAVASAVIVAGAVVTVREDVSSGLGFAAGLLVGGLVTIAALGAITAWLNRSR